MGFFPSSPQKSNKTESKKEESLDIPIWIQKLFNEVNYINKNGVLSQEEIDTVDRRKVGSACKLEAGMDIHSFISKNPSLFANYLNNDYGEILLLAPQISVNQSNGQNSIKGRFILDKSGKLIKTDEKRNLSEDDSNSLEVLQGQYAIKQYSQDTPQMQTYNLTSCVALTVYNQKTKTGFLCHVDFPQKTKGLENILSKLGNAADCEARIIGGDGTFDSNKIAEKMEKILKESKISLVERDINTKPVQNIQLNLETGEVTDYIETKSSTSKEEFNSNSLATLCAASRNTGLSQNIHSDF